MSRSRDHAYTLRCVRVIAAKRPTCTGPVVSARLRGGLSGARCGVFDHRVRPGIHQGRVSIIESNQERRTSVGATYLDDLAPFVRIPDYMTVYAQAIAYRGVHQAPPIRTRLTCRKPAP